LSSLQKAFDFQAIYNGLSLHFNKSYDYAKYGPLRRNQNADKFEMSPDRFIYIGFVRRFGTEEAFEEYLKLYGFRTGKVPYIRSFDNRDVETEFKDVWMKIRYSFEYNFDIMLNEISIQDLKTDGQSWPTILERLYDGKIYPSQFAALDRTYNLMAKYSKIFEHDPLFQDNYTIYSKYNSVTKIPEFDKLKTLIKTTLKPS